MALPASAQGGDPSLNTGFYRTATDGSGPTRKTTPPHGRGTMGPPGGVGSVESERPVPLPRRNAPWEGDRGRSSLRRSSGVLLDSETLTPSPLPLKRGGRHASFSPTPWNRTPPGAFGLT